MAQEKNNAHTISTVVALILEHNLLNLHPSTMQQRLIDGLRRQLESCKHEYTNVEDIVAHLHSGKNSEYGRMNRGQLTRMVCQLLGCSPPNKKRKKNSQCQCPNDSQNQKRPRHLDIHSDSDGDGTSKKKSKKKLEKSKEHLRMIESGTDDSSGRITGDGDGEEGTISTSEDTAFDITKSGLRERYRRANSAKKNIELEMMSTEKTKDKTEVGIGSEPKREAESSIAGSGDAFLVKRTEGPPRFRDFGGMKELLEMLIKEVVIPLYHPVLPRTLGVRPITGILLHGPPGCGKSKLAHAIANETGFAFYPVSGPEFVSGVSGSSEENIRELFQKAYRTAPSILFIDEIDAIASKRENLQREMERRIVTQLMTCMDGYHRRVQATGKEAELQNSQFKQGFVLVIAATNRPDALDPALRRPGRFDFEIHLGVPDEKARAGILSVLTKSLKVEGTLDLMKIARLTPGFVAADLEGLIVNAGRLATKRIVDSRNLEMSNISIDVDEEHAEQWWQQPWMPEEIEKHSVTMADIEEAVQRFQPSTRREGFSEIPNVTWEDVGGLDSLKEVFEDYITRRIKYPKDYEFFLGQSNLETCILLFGPPGCGKTLIAKAAASEAGANFIYIKGPELLNKYVGESELAIRTLFSRARTCSPCILFFDEVDAITKQRGTEGGWVVERLLNQFLIELDGGDHRHGVFVIGATNRIDVMDTALLRPGRFGKVIYVGLPTEHEREMILKALSRKMPIDPDVDLHAIARMEACKNLSGADLAALMNGAAMVAMKEKFGSSEDVTRDSSRTIKTVHVEQVLTKISPSVSKKDLRKLEKLAKKLNATS